MTRAKLHGAVLGCGMLFSLTACQGTHSDWTKPGAGPADLQRDLQDCRSQAVAMSPPVFDQRSQQVLPDELDILQRQTTCMMVGGWRLTPRQ